MWEVHCLTFRPCPRAFDCSALAPGLLPIGNKRPPNGPSVWYKTVEYSCRFNSKQTKNRSHSSCFLHFLFLSLSVCLSQTGNGPSGISLSYMLAGHWPYWSPEKAQKHPDELLRARLNYYDAQKSLVEHDLFSLADGLEGRSTNPVSLLVSIDRASGLDLLEWNNDLLTSLVGVLLPFLFPPFPAGQFAASVCRFGHGSAPDGRVPASSGEGGKQSNSHR